MLELVADLHTHTIASGHAYGTIREMAQAAGEAGLRILGITEHGPGVPGTCHPLYFTNLFTVPRELCGVSLLHGCEINVLEGGKLSLEQRWLNKLDYGIVGIHLVCYRDAGVVNNTDWLIRCMEDPKVRFVSHPDDSRTPLDYPALVAAAKELGVALEVNDSSFLKLDQRLDCLENYRRMLALCVEEGVPVVVDSDAHDPSRVGSFQRAAAFLEELDFPAGLVVNADAERVRRFIGTGRI